MAIKHNSLVIDLNPTSFKRAIGREPNNQEDFDRYYKLITSGVTASLDWKVILKNVKDEMDFYQLTKDLNF